MFFFCSEIIDLPPKSFVPKETIEYFKPKIHVEMDNPDKLDTVTEIHIKGWRVDKALMEVLNLCLPAVDQLNTLKYKLVYLNQILIKISDDFICELKLKIVYGMLDLTRRLFDLLDQCFHNVRI